MMKLNENGYQKCIKLDDYEDILNNKDLIETLEFNATKTQGCSQTSNGGSINVSRCDHMLTYNPKDESSIHVSFGQKFHMEQHYNYLHLKYNSKVVNKLLGVLFTKLLN